MFMDLEKQIEEYKKMIQSEPREEKIQETIRKSKEAFLLAEQQRMLTLHEFVWSQFKLIRKDGGCFSFACCFYYGVFFYRYRMTGMSREAWGLLPLCL